jgi:DNA modification methylase
VPTSLNHKKSVFDTLGRHPIHPFPARMAPGIALDALDTNKRPLRVLDPMVGSGTVLAVARANGHKAIGTDLDPLAVLLSKVWTTSIDRKKARAKAKEVLARARELFSSLSFANAYPNKCNEETKRFIRYWFDAYARKQLTSLSIAISRVRDRKIRDVLWCAFSRLIITKSAGASLAMDLAHSRPHREHSYAPVKPFNRFLKAVELVAANCPSRTEAAGPATKVARGDARDLDLVDDSIDLVLTSPPYLNAIDYMRCSKFSLVWMGHTTSALREIRAEAIGAEAACSEASKAKMVKSILRSLRLSPALSSRDRSMLSHYVWDMYETLGETARVLKARGLAIFVVGDSTVRGTFIRNSTIVSAAAQSHGLKLLSRRSRALPENRRYLPPPRRRGGSAALNARMRREVVLTFRKLDQTGVK